jgi:hypothetical protein
MRQRITDIKSRFRIRGNSLEVLTSWWLCRSLSSSSRTQRADRGISAAKQGHIPKHADTDTLQDLRKTASNPISRNASAVIHAIFQELHGYLQKVETLAKKAGTKPEAQMLVNQVAFTMKELYRCVERLQSRITW